MDPNPSMNASSEQTPDVLAPDPWHVGRAGPDAGGVRFAALLESMRRLQDRFVAALVPIDQIDAAVDDLDGLTDRFAPWQVDEQQSPSGARNDLPGRGNLLLPPFIIDQMTATSMRGRITFTRFHVGGNNAAHGGMMPLMFDDVLGRLVNGPDRPVARTAYLNVNYRSVARIGVEHHIEAEAGRVEGRKRFASGRVLAGDVLVADAEALFVELRPGQP
ncbi:MAG: hypothetical protein JWN99_839 [Ilumatobacteraceae bacterium]|nr:hypothetical protein [Ilumatobacteraceae bacterium]